MAAATQEPSTKPGGSRAELYDYQTWVHVGPGAENCEDVHEDVGTVECNNPLHFHAWLRLPNPFQHRDIRERALAAKARRIRALREPDTDLHEILEEEVDTLARRGEAIRPEIVDELVRGDWWKHLLDATRELGLETDDKDELRWQHIDEDRLRLGEIREMPTDDQPEPERDQIEKRLTAYELALEKKREELAQPTRDELEALDISTLLDRLRDSRIEAEGSAIFQHIYAEQEWLSCTYRAVDGEPWFPRTAELHSQPSSVISAIQVAFRDLEREKGGFAQGNS